MFVLSGYENLIPIYSGERSRVYRGHSLKDRKSIVLKVPRSDYPTPEELQRYRQEYRLTHRLRLTHVIQSYRLEEWGRSIGIVFEDFGGIPLKPILKSHPQGLPLDRFFPLALDLIEALGQLHSQNVIHKDLNPNNILVNLQSNLLKIIDLGISTQHDRNTSFLPSPDTLEGTLPYISPEQTGRITQKLDYRTDFYSLGVTFYELLTGQLPFVSEDPVELIYWHLVKQPPPLQECTERLIPEGLEAIVLKLMAKNADDRYQSAWGLKADVEQAYQRWQGTGQVAYFPLGQQDVPDRLQIPEKLYGREAELAILFNTWEQVVQAAQPQRSEVIIIQGGMGVGKSSLARSLQPRVTQRRGDFIEGKFDPFQRTIPYSALVTAFTALIRQRLTEPEDPIDRWRSQLLEAFSSNGQVLTSVIPELELVVGSQPPLPALEGNERQNRFHFLFRRFVRACCQADRPLVLVLDDMQWADVDSLHLLEHLLADPIPYFLPIFIFLDSPLPIARENCYTGSQQVLKQTLEGVIHQSQGVQIISLSSLSLEEVAAILQDTFQQDRSAIQPLAEVIYLKTQGNPLVLKQFLHTLYQDQYLVFDPSIHCWQWDVNRVQCLSLVEDMVDVVIHQLETLSPSVQNGLGMAACFGKLFDLLPLAWMMNTTPQQTFEQLKVALELGLILPRSSRDENGLIQHLQFSHDRIQQAAYDLIPQEERSTLHYRIGQKLLESQPSNLDLENLFEMVGHLNLGRDNIRDDRERITVARLNLRAAERSQSSTAYEAGLNYAEMGLAVLGEAGWTLDYDLTLTLHETIIQLLGLCGRWSAVEALITTLEERGRESLDLVNLYRFKIQYEISQNHLKKAIEIGIDFLTKLGFNLPENPSESEIQTEILGIKALLRDRPISDLAQLPPMSDRQQIGITEIITSLISPAYLCGHTLFPLVVILAVKLSIQYGNIPTSTFAYACYGIIACNLFNDLSLGLEFGELALGIVYQMKYKMVRPQVFQVVTTFILQRNHHLKEHLHLLREAYSVGLEVGNLEYGGYAYQYLCLTLFCLGQPLPTVAKEVSYATTILPQFDQHTTANYCRIYAYAIQNLREHFNPDLLLAEDLCEEIKLYEKLQDSQDQLGLCFFHLFKLILACFFQDWEAARQHGEEIQPYLRAAMGSIVTPMAYFYETIALLANLEVNSPEFNWRWQKIEKNQTILHEEWVTYAHQNYRHKLDLIQAEKYKVLGQKVEAIDAYDRAIEGAKTQGFLQDEALANERAAQFYLAWGKQNIGRTYLQEAHYVYTRWGASEKVNRLKIAYPQFLVDGQRSFVNESLNFSTTDGTNLDLQAMFKASQAITGEIVFEDLVQTLMQILKETTGAEIGALLLSDPTLDSELRVAIYSREDGMTIKPSASLKVFLPESILSYVNRTHEPVILGNLEKEEHFRYDPYLQTHHPYSILCYPLLNQGEIMGVVYLENRLLQGTFNSDRLKVLELLSGQIVISLQNAQLYTKVQSSQQQLQQFLEAVPLGIGIIDRQEQPYYVNSAAKEILGKGLVKNANSSSISETYQNYIARTNQIYPNDQLPVIKALKGESSMAEDIEIHQGDRIIPLEAWGTPIYDEAGNVQYGMAVFQDITDRKRSEQILQDSEARYRALAEVSPVGIFRNNLRGECIYANPKLEEMSGLSQEDLLGEGWSQMVYPEDLIRVYKSWTDFVSGVQGERIESNLESNLAYQLEYRYFAANGSLRWALVEVLPERNSAAEIVGFVGAIIDIHDRKEMEELLSDYSQSLEKKVIERTAEIAAINAQLEQEILDRQHIEEALRHSQEQLQQITNSVNAGIAYVDANLQYNFVNKIYAQQFGKNGESIQGKKVWDVIGFETYTKLKPIIDRVLQGESQSTELELKSISGETIYLIINFTPEFDSSYAVSGYYLIFFNITERKHLENSLQEVNNQLKQLANLDGLTQVANRRKFDDYLTQEWQYHLRSQECLSLIMFDVDYFKPYNDRYGHQKGDDCLIQIAQTVKQILTRPKDLVARYGGEEFAVILPQTSKPEAIGITEQIQAAIRALQIPHLKSQTRAIVSVSLGIASLIPRGDRSPEDLISLADQALYQAKETGRDRYVVH